MLHLSPFKFRANVTDEEQKAIQNFLETTAFSDESPDKSIVECSRRDWEMILNLVT
jgi:hypothetical protein